MPTRKPHHTHEVVARRDTGVHKAGQTVGYYQSSARARTAVDKHDNNYGAYAYQSRPLYMTDAQKTGPAAPPEPEENK